MFEIWELLECNSEFIIDYGNIFEVYLWYLEVYILLRFFRGYEYDFFVEDYKESGVVFMYYEEFFFGKV